MEIRVTEPLQYSSLPNPRESLSASCQRALPVCPILGLFFGVAGIVVITQVSRQNLPVVSFGLASLVTAAFSFVVGLLVAGIGLARRRVTQRAGTLSLLACIVIPAGLLCVLAWCRPG